MPAMRKGARHAARTRSAVVTLGGLLTLCVIIFSLHRYGRSTLDVELAAIRGWLAGDGLYSYRVPGSQIGAALSPALALLLAPLSLLPSRVAGWLLALASVAALLLTMVALAGPLARRHGRNRTTLVLTLTGLALLTGPVRATIGLGRPDLLLFGLIVADMVALRRVVWMQGRGAWVRARPTWLGTRAARLRSRIPWPSRRTGPLHSRIDSRRGHASGPRRTSWLQSFTARTSGRAPFWSDRAVEQLRDRPCVRQNRAARWDGRTGDEQLRDRIFGPRSRAGSWTGEPERLRRLPSGRPSRPARWSVRPDAESPAERTSWLRRQATRWAGRSGSEALRDRASRLRRHPARWPGRADEPLRERPLLTRLHRGWACGSWAGVGTGLATALSAAPLLFIAYLLITRQRRAALTALVTASVVTLVATAAAPAETLTWFGRALWELDRTAPIGTPDNLSLAGVLARLYGFSAPPVLVWLSFGILLLAVGLIRARSAHAEGDELAAFALVGLTVAVAGPVTAPAEAVWLLPTLMILADAALHRKLGARMARPARLAGMGCAVAAVAGYVVLVAGPDWTIGWNASAVALILLLNALPWRHGSRPMVSVRKPVREPAIPGPRGGQSVDH